MKQPKKLTREQKECLSAHYFVRCVLYTEFPEQSIYLGRAS